MASEKFTKSVSFKTTDDEKGNVEAVFSVFNNLDSDGDVVVPGQEPHPESIMVSHDLIPGDLLIEAGQIRGLVLASGETLRAEITLTERLSSARYVKAKVTSGGKTVLRLECVLAVAPTQGA